MGPMSGRVHLSGKFARSAVPCVMGMRIALSVELPTVLFGRAHVGAGRGPHTGHRGPEEQEHGVVRVFPKPPELRPRRVATRW